MKRLVALLSLLALLACSGQLVWRRPDGTYDPKQLRDDIDACETYTWISETKGPPRNVGARPYGGWGSSAFEYCMGQHNWVLEESTSEATSLAPPGK